VFPKTELGVEASRLFMILEMSWPFSTGCWTTDASLFWLIAGVLFLLEELRGL